MTKAMLVAARRIAVVGVGILLLRRVDRLVGTRWVDFCV